MLENGMGHCSLRMSESKIKIMLICFFDTHRIFHEEFVPQGQTINTLTNGFLKVWLCLLRYISRTIGSCTTTVLLVIKKFQERVFGQDKNISVTLEPSYYPHFGPHDFFLFSRLKIYLKRRYFGTRNIQTTLTKQLKVYPVFEFQHCSEEWKNRLQQCVASHGNYFEGHNNAL